MAEPSKSEVWERLAAIRPREGTPVTELPAVDEGQEFPGLVQRRCDNCGAWTWVPYWNYDAACVIHCRTCVARYRRLLPNTEWHEVHKPGKPGWNWDNPYLDAKEIMRPAITWGPFSWRLVYLAASTAITLTLIALGIIMVLQRVPPAADPLVGLVAIGALIGFVDSLERGR